MSNKQVVAICGCVSCGLCASDVVNVWVWVTVGVAAPCRCLVAPECVFNDIHYPLMSERSECGSFLWVCLLWSVGASDVVNVWVWVTVGVAAPCRCLVAPEGVCL